MASLLFLNAPRLSLFSSEGLSWSGMKPLDGETISTVPPGVGLYLLFEHDNGELVYIGQSADCAKRLMSHAMKFLDEKDLLFSSYLIEKAVLTHNLKKLENDLMGIILRFTERRRSISLGIRICSNFIDFPCHMKIHLGSWEKIVDRRKITRN